MLLLVRVLIARTSYFADISHNAPIDAHKIFSRYNMYYLTGSHIAQNLKMAILSLSLNLEAQYCTQSWTQSGATYSQGIVDLIYIDLKL